MRDIAAVNVSLAWLTAPRLNGVRVALEWKPQDLWIGAYWHSVHDRHVNETWHHVWVCLLPMLPIHISWHWWHNPVGAV